jgi:glycosyltransferase involved in cell wall biosynthesis
VAAYADHLAAMGHEVRVVAVGPRRPRRRERLRRLLTGQWKSPPTEPSHHDDSPVPLVRLSHPGPVTARDVPDADIVVATWWETASWVAALPPEKGAKVYFMQDYGVEGQELERIVPTWRMPFHIVTISAWLQDLVREHVPDASIAVVRNSVDLERFNAPPRERRGVPRIGFAYRRDRNKGMDLLLAALALARREEPRIEAVAFGSSHYLVHMLDGIAFHDRPADAALPAIYASCDAWIFPSLSEGFGLPILEAMACRTPVIATPAGAAPDLITPECGILLPDYTPESMSRAILQIARMDPASWSAMSRAARAAVETYTWDDAARAFEAELLRARTGATSEVQE